MNDVQVNRTGTALTRRILSRPFRLAIQDGLITPSTTVFDYGCGRGDDVRNLHRMGISGSGWDPNHKPSEVKSDADVVNLGYVVNVIENAEERADTLRSAWSLTRGLLVVAARLTSEGKEARFVPYEDGCLTSRSTFQKFFEQHELKEWIDSVLGETSVPAGPGVFYIFRDPVSRESFLASRFRRMVDAPRFHRPDLLFEQHAQLLTPLINFVSNRGRLPDDSELDVASEICSSFGSLKRAFSVIRRVTGSEQWEVIAKSRAQDLLIYIALAKFGGRPRMSSLPTDIQLDVRAFFSTYTHACEVADKLLFSAGDTSAISQACQNSPIGKLTPGSLYVHTSGITFLPPILRIYEGCARAYIGSVEGANIIKLKHRWPQVSYLAYPDFELNPHPALFASLVVTLRPPRTKYMEYSRSINPPILHRKETFLPPEHPLKEKFARLTRQEEHHGLFDDSRVIGTKNGWEAVLQERGFTTMGHRLIKLKSISPPS